MFVPHNVLLQMLRQRDSQPQHRWRKRTYRAFMPLILEAKPIVLITNRPHQQWQTWLVMHEWLQRLPDSDKCEKIRSGFTARAEECSSALIDFCWWDIDPVKRHIMAIVKRSDGMNVPVLLMWKKSPITAMQRTPEQTVQGHAGWEWHPSLYTWRFAIEGETYYDVIEKFTQWLGKPLSQHPPQFQPRPPQFAFAHVPPYGHSPFPFRPGRFFR